MKKKISTLPILLVVLWFGSYTQARLLAVQHGDGVIPNSKENSDELKDDVPRTKSVVQNWSLVCEQLCGAELGGPLCDPQCKTALKPHSQQQSEITPPTRFGKICSILCKYQLGGSECPCQIFALPKQIDVNSLDRNSVCDAFCTENNITVAGCSPCFEESISTQVFDRHGGDTFTPLTARNIQANAPETSDDQTPKLPTEDESVQSSTQATTSSTPNWDEVCLSLCKIGEGGALCNCDLPPFF